MRAFFTLLAATWRYAEGRRHVLLLYVAMFIAANGLHLLEPYVIGRVLNAIQDAAQSGEAVRSLRWLLAAMLGLAVGFWIFHGPARVLENNVAFHIRTRLVDHLFRILVRCPVQW